MTRAQARNIVNWIMMPYGQVLSDEDHERWFNAALERVDYQEGLDAARGVYVLADGVPTPANFSEALRNLRKVQEERRLMDEIARPEFTKAELAAAREKLEAAG